MKVKNLPSTPKQKDVRKSIFKFGSSIEVNNINQDGSNFSLMKKNITDLISRQSKRNNI